MNTPTARPFSHFNQITVGSKKNTCYSPHQFWWGIWQATTRTYSTLLHLQPFRSSKFRENKDSNGLSQPRCMHCYCSVACFRFQLSSKLDKGGSNAERTMNVSGSSHIATNEKSQNQADTLSSGRVVGGSSWRRGEMFRRSASEIHAQKLKSKVRVFSINYFCFVKDNACYGNMFVC